MGISVHQPLWRWFPTKARGHLFYHDQRGWCPDVFPIIALNHQSQNAPSKGALVGSPTKISPRKIIITSLSNRLPNGSCYESSSAFHVARLDPTVDGRNPAWETIVCWYLQGTHHFRVSWVVQDFVHPQYEYESFSNWCTSGIPRKGCWIQKLGPPVERLE